MRGFDSKFSQNKLRYLLQCILATVSAMMILVVLNSMNSNAVILASLGASCFIAFCMPHHRASRPGLMIGGYIVGIGVGILCWWLAGLFFPGSQPTENIYAKVIFGGLATGLAMFLMVVTNTEHPPAASLALGFILGPWQLLTVVVALVEIILLCLLKRLLKPLLINLL